MQKLAHADLLSLEQYARERTAFRARAIAHKRARSVPLGPHLTLLFEDRTTVQYQVQEMLRIERIFEPGAIAEELGAYNPLIPDGSNLKATLLIEYPDIDERRRALENLRGIEHRIELLIGDSPPVLAVADEDLPRSNKAKTAAVHFLRFELSAAQIRAWHGGARIGLRVRHPFYTAEIALNATQSAGLGADLDA